MAIADRFGLLPAVHVDSASQHEVKLVQKTLESRLLTQLPDRIIGDKAYDSDPLDAQMQAIGIEMIAPHRSSRKKSQNSRW